MRKVIVNSTPIISLAKIGQLNILKNLYDCIIIPQAVYSELTAKNDTVCEQVLISKDWIQIMPITNDSTKKLFSTRLHAGEVEVMILAQEIHADLTIIDDYAARKTAEILGIPLTGTIGVLIKAKKLGIIPSVMKCIDDMQDYDIYFSDALIQQIKKLTGELMS